MARGRAANGAGMQPRKRKDGLWEVRISVKDPITGKCKQKSIYGKTSEEVSRKQIAATAEIQKGSYIEPTRMTVSEWLKIWINEYTTAIKPGTVATYSQNIKNHIDPSLGAIRLTDLQPHTIQSFINRLSRTIIPKKGTPISPKTVKNIHGTLCKALSEAVRAKYIPSNPAEGCNLPKGSEKDISPLDKDEAIAFIEAVKGNPSEDMFMIALETGMRLSELLGLRWSRIDMKKSTIKVDTQLLVRRKAGADPQLGTPKNGKSRSFVVSPTTLSRLRGIKRRQQEQRMAAGEAWHNGLDLVFTNELGQPIPHSTMESRTISVYKAAGLEGHRFHDLRHTFATDAIRAGMDIKTLSERLGHYSVSFTLDRYGHVTKDMQDDSAQLIEQTINGRKMGIKLG